MNSRTLKHRRPGTIRTLAVLVATMLWLACGLVSVAAAAPKASPTLTNTICPVMEDEPVDPDIFLEYGGRRVYFCCDLCLNRFKANPARYAEELARVMPTLETEANIVVGAAPAGGHPHPTETGPDDETADHADMHDNDDEGAVGGVLDSGSAHSESDESDHADAEAGHVHGGEQTVEIATDNQEHDHSAHQPADAANPLVKFLHWLGKFHPPAVAFPIGLLIAAGVAELLFAATRRPTFDYASRFCAWFGIGVTVLAGILGWFFAGFRLTDPSWIMTTHRWVGTAATAWALLLIVPTAKTWSGGDDRRWRLWYRLALLVAILLVGTNAFFGGAMIYGLDHYAW